MPGPLEGVRVLDFTSMVAGPVATMMLADQGAEVIKLEPPRGDLMRHLSRGRNGMSGFFLCCNRNKRSLAVEQDLTKKAAAAAATTTKATTHHHRPRPPRHCSERIRNAVESTPFILEADVASVTLSLGVAAYPEDGHNGNELVDAADRRMYTAKQGGGNAVVLATL